MHGEKKNGPVVLLPWHADGQERILGTMELDQDAQKIRDLRVGRGWTQERLANEAGVNVRTVQRLEHGDRTSPSKKAQLLRAMGRIPQDLRIEELQDRVAELEEASLLANPEPAPTAPLQDRLAQPKEARASLTPAPPTETVMRVMYYLHPYHEIIDYDVPADAPIPRVGEFVVVPRTGPVEKGESPVQSFKVVRVLYAHKCYMDSPVRVQVDMAPAISFD